MAQTDQNSGENLTRALESRHVQLIAIGGAIGVGLFLGSSTAIKTAGPGLLLSYIIGGLIIFFVMRALGEIAVEHPVSGSFSAYANKFMGPFAGYITGWTYWFLWIITGMAEITAVGVYCTFWWPELPQWIPALLALLSMTCINLISVRLFGEIEFWFSLIKVVTIIAMIIIGLGIIFFGIGSADGEPTGIKNLYALEGGFLPNGMTGVIMALSMVMFAFVGIELIGVAAGETCDPEKNIPSAVNKVLWRILIFYIGALFVIMAIFPWMGINASGGASPEGSPFVLTFKNLGIKSAAGIINFVVATAALSSCNSGIFSNGRMLYNLALQKRAPWYFAQISSHHVPSRGIIVSSCVMLIGVILNYFLPEKVFLIVTSIATFAALWIWATIVMVQIKSRKGMTPEDVKKIKFKMPFYPVTSYIALVGLIFVGIILWFSPSTRIAMVVGPLWLVFLTVMYYLLGWNKLDQKGLKINRPAVE